MSGGVDSSVAAALLVQAGYDVTGVFMCLGAAGHRDADSHGCCSPQDAADARRVAETLGIELYVLDLSAQFESIIDYFAAEYAAGRTPNPCVRCNTQIKFGRLMDRADSLGARYVASGHYARRVDADGASAVARGAARAKDQSYVLFGIPRDKLRRMLLPLGDIEDKARVRQIASDLGLNVHAKPDSQEICFVPDDDYSRLLAQRAPQALAPGNIVDVAGKILGRHDGYARYTIGQRKGLRIAARQPLYVTDIDPATATVTLGPQDAVMARRARAVDANWHADVPEQFEAIVQIRYNHAGAPGRVRRLGPAAFEVDFDEPVAAITPGQAAVVYARDNDRLLGGGWITRER